MTGLTTHVLDTMRGGGGGGISVKARRLAPEPHDFGSFVLDEGGRGVLIQGDQLTPGTYELLFDAGTYHGAAGGFWSEIPIRFAVTDSSQHYHIPLILSAYGYSTYRGG